jgi:tryptophan halogenase
LLIQQALKTPFVPFANNLFNDAAVAMPTPIDEDISPQTVSTALKNGWAWKIPLTERYGNGYVYSSAFCSADEAEHELRAHLGLLDSSTPARHLKMKVGRVTRHWNRNCLAVGLSQGFIEPLEATALLFIQRTISNFVEFLESGDVSERAQDSFNQWVNDLFEGTRDYIVTHYKTNTRSDTDYWRANAANKNISEPLQQLFRQWMSGKSIVTDVTQRKIGKGYPVFSWYCIMSGMGVFPDASSLRDPAPNEAPYKMSQIDNLLQRAALNFRKHRDVLGEIPPKPQDDSLQLYFW